jgi:chromosome segregation ATPase
MKRRVVAGSLLLMAAIAAGGILRIGATARERHALQTLRDSVHALRSRTEACAEEVRAGEAALGAFRAELDSLYDQVRAFESARDRVPQAVYAEYLAEYEAYQAASGSWESRVASLEQRLSECRALADAHTVSTDSLRQRLLRRRN